MSRLIFLAAVALATLIVFVLLPLYSKYQDHQAEKRAKRMMDTFAKEFPGRCPICSYHWYGISHGFLDPDERVEVHQCPERENFGWRGHR